MIVGLIARLTISKRPSEQPTEKVSDVWPRKVVLTDESSTYQCPRPITYRANKGTILLPTKTPRTKSIQQHLGPYSPYTLIHPLLDPSPKVVVTLSTMSPPILHQHSSRNHSTTSTTTATATQTLTSTPVLRLRATAPSPQNRRRIQWAEDVVDNEGLGRKRSKGSCYTPSVLSFRSLRCNY